MHTILTHLTWVTYPKNSLAYSDTKKTKKKVEKAFSSVEDMPNWEQIYFSMINLFMRNNDRKI